jgi:hypothetical protein
MSTDLALPTDMVYLEDMTRPSSFALAPPTWESPPVEDPELEKIARDYTRARATVVKLRPQLYAHIYDFKQRWGTERGWQTWVVRMTGFTREQIRQIIAAEEDRRRKAGEDSAS